MGDIVLDANGLRIGFETCEDSWISNRPGRDLYQRNVDVILNPSASHFAVGKYATREQFIKEGSRAFGVAYAYANLNGTENGTSIFDAGCLIASESDIVSRGDRLNVKEILINHALVNVSANRVNRIVSSESIKNDGSNDIKLSINLTIESDQIDLTRFGKSDEVANDKLPGFWDNLKDQDLTYTEICYAIGTGLWDWTTRTKTNGYIVSLSGGADSGLVAALVYLSHFIALEQVGTTEYIAKLPEQIKAELPNLRIGEDKLEWLKAKVMPKILWCLYQGTNNSSTTTFSAAQKLAEEVGATFHDWNVAPLVQQYTDLVNGLYPGRPLSWETDDITLQNIQARSRSPGVWMLANRENKLLIATSNLSESALGYATMDGDTSGVLSAISGLSKTTIRKINVWLEETGLPARWENGFVRTELSQLKWINAQQPTAELRPNEQTDEEDLMPYEICDFIMDCYLVKQMWPKSILVELMMNGFGAKYDLEKLGGFIERWFTLFCRNPWKRYGTRAGFHIEQISLDPKTFHRFPLLNSGFTEPLEKMWDYIQTKSK
jgi:NAD+ synthase (glutamine-hydrolysing)